MDMLTQLGYDALDKGLVPDFVIRRAIRLLCNQRLKDISTTSMQQSVESKWQYIEELKRRPVAIETDKANQQHYEVSTEFIKSCLGPRMKYSCCLYPTGKETLEQAEILMLDTYCEKAKLQDGMDVLDLGCGWGSLSLYLAEKYPNSRITSLSNSSTQKIYIDSQAALKKFKNLEVFTGDVKEYDFVGKRSFDRILSIEMFEHMKNYEFLLQKVSTWLKPNKQAKSGESLLFVHIFCHRDTPYHFEEGDGWMTKHFFSGGTMPSFDLFTYFQKDLVLQKSWWLNGQHYGRTCQHWLQLQDSNRKHWLTSSNSLQLVTPSKSNSIETTEKDLSLEGIKSFNRFRVFFMACEEFFNLNGGESWGVGHYLFKKRD
ncbi:hypothetical protein OIO90_004975 [Microbotryomycetes sp. JL221]|nr:hypothetical protein OIO90_004975 [Microbotryomycetes sp. JL221]